MAIVNSALSYLSDDQVPDNKDNPKPLILTKSDCLIIADLTLIKLHYSLTIRSSKAVTHNQIEDGDMKTVLCGIFPSEFQSIPEVNASLASSLVAKPYSDTLAN